MFPTLLSGCQTTTNNTAKQINNKHSSVTKPNIINLSKDEAKEVGKDLTKAVSNMLETSDKLEQDKMEGVDESEWNED